MSNFFLGQWNDPRRERPERERTEHYAPESTSAECPRCQATNLRPCGWFHSKVWEEKHQQVQCNACRHYFRLPVGVTVAIKERVTSPDSVRGRRALRIEVLANDPRPRCPHCGGNRIQRKEQRPGGRRRWHCAGCDRRFIAEDSAAFIDHRKVLHWQELDPKDEAVFLFRYGQRHSDVRGMRRLIAVSDKQRGDLELLVSEGVLTESEVADALWFRSRVLEIFDGLIAEHERCKEFLAERGMTADRLAAPFAKLVDVEAAVMLESLEVECKGETQNGKDTASDTAFTVEQAVVASARGH